MNFLIGDIGNTDIKVCLVNKKHNIPNIQDKETIKLLIPSIKDSQPIYNQKSAIKYLSLHVKNKEIRLW